MSAPPHVVLETATYFTWFGLSLWDDAAGIVVSDGISVRVFTPPISERSRPTTAFANRSGVFVAHNLPAHTVTSPGGAFLVEVIDTLDRFTSFVMSVTPADEWGFVQPGCPASLVGSASPALRQLPVPLFNTPARPAPAGAAVVRATLIDAADRQPAQHALLEVRFDGRLLGRGIANARGEAVAMFAYPEPEPPPPWSPPGAPPRPQRLTDQRWPLDVAVRYRDGVLVYETDPAKPPLPDLCDVLAQPPAAIVVPSPPGPIDDTTLRYGEELVIGGPDGLLVRAS